jgi:hypothetical protein
MLNICQTMWGFTKLVLQIPCGVARNIKSKLRNYNSTHLLETFVKAAYNPPIRPSIIWLSTYKPQSTSLCTVCLHSYNDIDLTSCLNTYVCLHLSKNLYPFIQPSAYLSLSLNLCDWLSRLYKHLPLCLSSSLSIQFLHLALYVLSI